MSDSELVRFGGEGSAVLFGSPSCTRQVLRIAELHSASSSDRRVALGYSGLCPNPTYEMCPRNL